MVLVKASEFKAKCLKMMEEIAQGGEAITITKHGVPLVKVIPVHQKPETLFGALKGSVDIHGDITEPIDVAWDADSDD